MQKDILNDSSPLCCNAPMTYQNIVNCVEKQLPLVIVNLPRVEDLSVVVDPDLNQF